MEKIYQILILRRIKKILKDKELTTYKLQKKEIVRRLNDYFWDQAGGLNGFWNKMIYKKQVQFLNKTKEKHKDKTGINYRTTYSANLDIRTEEIITRLIDQDILRADDDLPPSYYIVYVSVWRFFILFKWIIIDVIFLGLIVAIVANLLSNYVWEIWIK